MPLLSFGDHQPRVDPTAWVAGSAELVGDVTLHADSSVWYQSVLRAELAPITLGAGSNLQDGCVVHTDEDFPTTIGARVSVGHRAVLHGCTIGDGALVGMGAVVLNGAVVGEECLVAAGAVVPEGMVVPPRTLVAGVPAKVRRELDDASLLRVRANSVIYVELAQQHRDTARPVPADGS
ncbi:gamma carbonic anhydrase family protein [Lapillicoccus jejuensis]|uniref:Carbonic anhydrase/acetyltransferase-like protein (Isoleucine patch superfamily) n=1 Tax=Lapillicoccus jejuensis TaxID=402171 RepID=A0A542E1K6_9MICO|nr:gamma carbonic anhydrase family protein [Lapillicoccus jejuensis]TQJ09231.1 carbonic anhydrase/acetyltransferase-like protein (isoleucine patch superfamily) [Lapillicoccus jejuensis]